MRAPRSFFPVPPVLARILSYIPLHPRSTRTPCRGACSSTCASRYYYICVLILLYMCLHTHTPLIQDNTMHQHHPCAPCASGPNSPNSPGRKEQTAEIQAEVVEEAQSVLAEAEQKLKRAAEVFAINCMKEKGL